MVVTQPSSSFCLSFTYPAGFQPPYRHGCTADLPHQSSQCQSEGWPSWPNRPRPLLQVGTSLVFLFLTNLQLGDRLCTLFFFLTGAVYYLELLGGEAFSAAPSAFVEGRMCSRFFPCPLLLAAVCPRCCLDNSQARGRILCTLL